MSFEIYPEVQVGMEVFVVYASHRKGGSTHATVLKVGKKWAELSNHERMLVSGRWIMDGGKMSTPGECFPSGAHYLHRLKRVEEWQDLKNRMGYIPPDSVSADDIQRAAVLLGIKIAKN